MTDRHDANPEVPFRDGVRVWLRVAALSFGGPAGQIATMHRILVDEKRWISEERFLHALNYCMLLPGPEAQQLSTYIGWLLHRTAGGLVAGILFVLPGFLSILVLSMLYAGYREAAFVEALFFGIKAAVLAVVAEAVLRMGKRVLRNGAMVLIAGAAFVAIFLVQVPFPLIVLGAGVLGILWDRLTPDGFAPRRTPQMAGGGGPTAVDALLQSPGGVVPTPTRWRTLRVILLWAALWIAPIVALFLALGGDHVFTEIAVFFSKLAVVTFGGAYAALAYVAQEAVQVHGWLAPGEMLDGLGMAETTPGPLIQVVQFVGFLGAYRDAGALDPLLAGVLASVLVTWVTFVPCFLWIFAGAPYIEALRGNRVLDAALSAITAAVVGVVLNLAIWFGLYTLFGQVNLVEVFGLKWQIPEWESLDAFSLLLAMGAFVALWRFRLGMVPVIFVSSLAGMVGFLLR